MTHTTKQQAQRAMAQSLSHIMDTIEDDMTIEITSDLCVMTIGKTRFCFTNNTDELATAIESLEWLAGYIEAHQ